MVSTGFASWQHSGGSWREEFIMPPVQLDSTKSKQLAAGLTLSLDRHLLGMGLEVWMDVIARKFATLQICVVADSAAANLKLLWKFMAYMQLQGKRVESLVLGYFNPCLLHQLARVLVMNLERAALHASLYSITRLNQHTPLRAKTWTAVVSLLKDHFKFELGIPPIGLRRSTADGSFRRNLMRLLTGFWDWEQPSTSKQEALLELFTFFNGDLMSETSLVHFCSGCCQNRQHSLDKVRWALAGKTVEMVKGTRTAT